jgi:hypothetical protein
MTMSFTVDVHHHILPDVFWRATNDALTAPTQKESAQTLRIQSTS